MFSCDDIIERWDIFSTDGGKRMDNRFIETFNIPGKAYRGEIETQRWSNAWSEIFILAKLAIDSSTEGK